LTAFKSISERPQGTKKKIIMMINEGCSGSSAAQYTLQNLLELHGIAVYSPEKEFFKDDKAVKKRTCYKSGNDSNFFSKDKVARLEQAWNVLVNKSGCDPDLPTTKYAHTHTHTHTRRTNLQARILPSSSPVRGRFKLPTLKITLF